MTVSDTPPFEFRGELYNTVRPAEFDGEWMVRRIHRIAATLGYERVRVDRGQIGGSYYEVGYGPLYTVHLTTSRGEVFQVTKENWAEVSEDAIRALLQRNREESR